MVLLGELDELALAHIVTKPKPLLAHARADLDNVSGLSQDASMNHLPIEGTHDHSITCVHSVNQLTARDNVLIQLHASNEGRGERQDITVDDKTSKRDHVTVKQVP